MRRLIETMAMATDRHSVGATIDYVYIYTCMYLAAAIPSYTVYINIIIDRAANGYGCRYQQYYK